MAEEEEEEKGKNKAQEAIENTSEKANEGIKKASDEAKKAPEKVKEKADEVKEKADEVKEDIDSTKETAKESIDSTKEAAKESINEVKDSTVEAVEASKEAIDTVKSIPTDAVEAVKEVADDAKEAVKEVADTAKEAYNAIKDALFGGEEEEKDDDEEEEKDDDEEEKKDDDEEEKKDDDKDDDKKENDTAQIVWEAAKEARAKISSVINKLQKLKIYPEGEANNAFEAMVNPSTISYSTEINYVDNEAQGNFKSESQFNSYEDETISFTLILDGTGIIGKNAKTVSDSIQKFKDVAFDYNGDEHEPNYVTVAWGESVNFDGRLKSFSIEYKLFTPQGDPLRADMDVSFVGATSPKKEATMKNNSSPDLTHIRVVKAGDTLPMMCEKIYKNSAMYIEVAKVNDLVNFRKLEPGTEIIFPPLKK